MKKINKVISCQLLKPLTLFIGIGVVGTASANSLGLVDIYNMAVNNDAKIAQAQAQFAADSQSIDSAKAALLPQIQADGSYFITDSSIDTTDVTSRDLSITLNQSIYQHANWARYNQAKYSSDAALQVFKTAEQDLILRVSQAYFDVLLAQKTLELAKNKENADLTQFETAKASAELGLSSKVDVLQAKSSYDLSRSDTINSENGLDVALESLAKISGKPLSILKSTGLKVMLANVALPKMTLDAKALEAKAATDNLGVKTASAQLESASEEIEVQKSGHWPSVAFQARYTDTAYTDYESTAIFADSNKTSVGVTVSMPLYSGGGTSSQVTAAKHKTIAAQQGLRDNQETAKLNVRTLVRNLQRGEKLISALREAVNSNNAFVESAEEGYKVGLKSMLEVLTARTNQSSANKNLIEAIHNQVINHLKVEQAIGDLTLEDLAQYEPLLSSVSK